ncbi:hypothetical protein Efla_001875 [Eimeria flavescens]
MRAPAAAPPKWREPEETAAETIAGADSLKGKPGSLQQLLNPQAVSSGDEEVRGTDGERSDAEADRLEAGARKHTTLDTVAEGSSSSKISLVAPCSQKKQQQQSPPTKTANASKSPAASLRVPAEEPGVEASLLSSPTQQEPKPSCSAGGWGSLGDPQGAATAGKGVYASTSSAMLPLLYEAGDAGKTPFTISSSGGEVLLSVCGKCSQSHPSAGCSATAGAFINPTAAAHGPLNCGLTEPFVPRDVPLETAAEGGEKGLRGKQQLFGPRQQQAGMNAKALPVAGPSPLSVLNTNIPVILTAIRRYLRSLVRIMYTKHPLSNSEEAGRSGSFWLGKNSSNRGNHSSSVKLSAASDRHNGSETCFALPPKASKTRWLSPGYEKRQQISKESNIMGAATGSLMRCAASPQNGPSSPASDHSARSSSPVMGDTEQEAEAVACEPFSGRRDSNSPDTSVLLPPVASPADGAAQSWEGQCIFHDSNLCICPLSELSEYLSIFSPFLSMPFTVVTGQHPTKLQHVRLQLLLLRNRQQYSHRYQEQQRRPLVLRQWPMPGPSCPVEWRNDTQSIARCLALEGSSGLREATCPAIVPEPSAPFLAFDSSTTANASSFSRPKQPFTSRGPFAGDAAAPALAPGGQMSNSEADVTGACRRTIAPSSSVGTSSFPSSSVDAFAVDDWASTASMPLITASRRSANVSPTSPDASSAKGTSSLASNFVPCLPPAADDLCARTAPAFHPAKERGPLFWDSRNISAAKTSPRPSALRWTSVGGAAVGLRLPCSLEAGRGSGLGDPLCVSALASASMIQHGGAAGAGVSAALAGVETRGQTAHSCQSMGSLSGEASAPGTQHILSTNECFREEQQHASLNNSHKANGLQRPVTHSMLINTRPQRSVPLVPSLSIDEANKRPGSFNAGMSASPASLGLVIPPNALGSGRTQRGNVQVTFSPQMGAWVVCCASGLLQQSRAFPVVALGFEGAKKTAQQYATQCRRHCSSKRILDRGPGYSFPEGGSSSHRCRKETSRRSGSAVLPIPQVSLGLAGPAGGAFNLAKSNSQDFIFPKSDFSASRVARLSRRAMELPYVHGVRFEAANFAWVAQMRGETRRFLVKKHGFVKSRLFAIEKIELWRSALSPEALATELKAEQEVLAMVPNTSLEEADPDAMHAVEESLRLKFQHGALLSKTSAEGQLPAGVKRQGVWANELAKQEDGSNSSEGPPTQQQQQQAVSKHSSYGQSNATQLRHHMLHQAQQELLHHLPPQPLCTLPASRLPDTQQARRAGSLQQPVLLSVHGVSSEGQQKQQLRFHHFSVPSFAAPGFRT